MPEKSAALVKAVGIPMAPRVPGNEYTVLGLNFGKYTLTLWDEADSSRD